MNEIDQAALFNIKEHVAATLAKEIDRAISTSLTELLGPSWKLQDLVGRLSCRTRPGSGIEDFFLDNKLIVTVHPVELVHDEFRINVTSHVAK